MLRSSSQWQAHGDDQLAFTRDMQETSLPPKARKPRLVPSTWLRGARFRNGPASQSDPFLIKIKGLSAPTTTTKAWRVFVLLLCIVPEGKEERVVDRKRNGTSVALRPSLISRDSPSLVLLRHHLTAFGQAPGHAAQRRARDQGGLAWTGGGDPGAEGRDRSEGLPKGPGGRGRGG